MKGWQRDIPSSCHPIIPSPPPPKDQPDRAAQDTARHDITQVVNTQGNPAPAHQKDERPGKQAPTRHQ